MASRSTTVISLSTKRKQMARSQKRAEADANAVKFGRTTAEKKLEEARAAKEARRLDQHRREEE